MYWTCSNLELDEIQIDKGVHGCNDRYTREHCCFPDTKDGKQFHDCHNLTC